MSERQVIALAGGTGDLGRYLHEELTRDGRFSVVLLTRRAVPTTQYNHTTTHTTDYTEPSLLNILNATGATALISTIRCDNSAFLPLHTALLHACLHSRTCKTFIPSEWGGNSDDFPDLPISYGKTRAPLRKLLYELAPPEAESKKLKWTLVNLGWFMDYFLRPEKTYMKYIDGEFPLYYQDWSYTVRGSGDEIQSWTFGRDVARAVVALLGCEQDWEPVTYVSGGWGTFNEAAKLVERFYDRPFTRKYRTLADIEASMQEYENNPANDEDIGLPEIEHFTVSGAVACPKETTLRQRAKYFSKLHFTTVEELLEMGARTEGRV
ncbi:hypothetical protein BJX99DRAFT_254781 [Aspergillus californicus]